MRTRTIPFCLLLIAGCHNAPPPSQSQSPQDTYIKEATVLEHLQAEFDRLTSQQRAEWKSAQDLLKEAQYWETRGNQENSRECRAMMDQSTARGKQAGDDAVKCFPAILIQQSRVDAAKEALALTKQ